MKADTARAASSSVRILTPAPASSSVTAMAMTIGRAASSTAITVKARDDDEALPPVAREVTQDAPEQDSVAVLSVKFVAVKTGEERYHAALLSESGTTAGSECDS